MPQVAGLAKQIMDKWSRMVFGISTTYVDRHEDAEDILPRRDQYRRLKQKIERIAQDAEDEQNESDNEEVGTKRQRKKQKVSMLPDEQEIVRGRAGIIMPARNAFDFVDKPTSSDCMGNSQYQAKNSGHERIKKTMNNLKRFNRMSF